MAFEMFQVGHTAGNYPVAHPPHRQILAVASPPVHTPFLGMGGVLLEWKAVFSLKSCSELEKSCQIRLAYCVSQIGTIQVGFANV